MNDMSDIEIPFPTNGKPVITITPDIARRIYLRGKCEVERERIWLEAEKREELAAEDRSCGLAQPSGDDAATVIISIISILEINKTIAPEIAAQGRTAVAALRAKLAESLQHSPTGYVHKQMFAQVTEDRDRLAADLRQRDENQAMQETVITKLHADLAAERERARMANDAAVRQEDAKNAARADAARWKERAERAEKDLRELPHVCKEWEKQRDAARAEADAAKAELEAMKSRKVAIGSIRPPDSYGNMEACAFHRGIEACTERVRAAGVEVES